MTASAIIAVVMLLINYTAQMDLPDASSSHTTSTPTGPAAEALTQLGTTDPNANDVDYARTDFGQPWSDAATGVSGARNGCDTASDVLRRDLNDVVIDPTSQGCSPATGELIDPYTSQRETYTRNGNSTVHVDHVVSAADGCTSGLCSMDTDTRQRFANDPLNLLATTAAANLSKGDRAADNWPADTQIGRSVTTAGHCVLVVRQIAVKTSYELTVTAAERKTMESVLTRCPETTMPTPAETNVPTPSR